MADQKYNVVKCTKDTNVSGYQVYVKGEKYKYSIKKEGAFKKLYEVESPYGGIGVFDKDDFDKRFKKVKEVM